MAASFSRYPNLTFRSIQSQTVQFSPGKLGASDNRLGGDTQRTLSASDAPHPPIRTTGEAHD